MPRFEYLKLRIKLLLGRGYRKAYGQFAEDVIAQKMIKARTLLSSSSEVFYIDAGAHHPVFLSNTYAMYLGGGRGIAIDANPELQSIFTKVRPRDTFVNCGLGLAGVSTYYTFEKSAHNTFSQEELSHKAKQGVVPTGRKQILNKTLTAIVREHNVTRIDFLNLDIEGKELEVLNEYDWSVRPAIICIEAKQFDPMQPQHDPSVQFLQKKQYELRSFVGQCLFFQSAV